jgi:hypothetical protein
MKTIWKYTLNVTDTQSIEVPMMAQILTAQLQNKELQLWMLVDSEEEGSEYITIRVYGTGHSINEENLEYINTFQEGSLVFHVFKEL